jgi:hypothetical protein
VFSARDSAISGARGVPAGYRVELQRFSVPKLAEHMTRADREGLEAHVDEVSAPSKVLHRLGLLDAELVRIFEDAAAWP